MDEGNKSVLEEQSCDNVRQVFNRIGDKWSLNIIGQLSAGPKRFTELRRDVAGISQRMLTLTLKGLEQDGLICRAVTPTSPPRVDYDLTALGHTLRSPLTAFMEWAMAHHAEIEASRERYASER